MVRKKARMGTLYLTPLFYSAGNAAEDIYWALKRGVVEERRVEIVSPYRWTQFLGYRICNEALFCMAMGDAQKIRKKNVNRLAVRAFVNVLFASRRLIGLFSRRYLKKELPSEWYFPVMGKGTVWPLVKHKMLDEVKLDPVLKEVHNPMGISMNPKSVDRCRKELRKYGVEPHGMKYVCLHVREAGFHGDHKRRGYRNADIENYYPAIEYLIKKNYRVIRLGDNSMKPMALVADMLIDYPFADIKSPEMDLFLIKNCSFFIGMQSGVLDFAMLFERPILTLNMYDWFFGYPLKVCDRGLLQKIVTRDGMEFVGLEDRVEMDFRFNDWRSCIDGKEARFVQNNAEQILESVMRFESQVNGGNLFEDSGLIEENRSIYRRASDKILADKKHSFFSHSALNISRIMLRNLASQGALYDL